MIPHIPWPEICHLNTYPAISLPVACMCIAIVCLLPNNDAVVQYFPSVENRVVKLIHSSPSTHVYSTHRGLPNTCYI